MDLVAPTSSLAASDSDLDPFVDFTHFCSDAFSSSMSPGSHPGCKFQEWVHPDTTPYASIIRSACLLLGAAIANRFIKWSPVRSFPLNDSPTVFYRCISALLGLCAGFSYSLLQSLVPRPPAFHSTELSRQVILFYSASGFLAVGFTLCVLCLVPQLAVFLSGGRRRRPF
ncbi:unnamed protein product [Cyprideis torosa]|uniref:Uncharacterized protein n=1 Tax=Cyprideis torosa TaxID=163714 RepID=A0A7R8ZMP8_9CRUS|nr:unnamed protein product [Cyprideis torosa]CAG0896117.1 unnamed protein product [Cyprideis torosa]